MAEGQGFEPWVGYKPTPVFKTGALNHSATLPLRRKLYIGFSDQQYAFIKKTYINDVFLKIIISENKNRARCSVFIHHLTKFTNYSFASFAACCARFAARGSFAGRVIGRGLCSTIGGKLVSSARACWRTGASVTI